MKASVKASVKSIYFNKASVEITSVEAFMELTGSYFYESFHGSFLASMKASTASMKSFIETMETFLNFHQTCR